MHWLKQLGIMDAVVVTVVMVAIFMPDRDMQATLAGRGDAAAQKSLASAEAEALANPGSGTRVAEYARQLSAAGHLDWAAEASIAAAADKAAPERWRSLLAASVAYTERLDAKPALEWAQMAVASCTQASEAVCPPWESARLQMFYEHLAAGVRSGIDSRKDPEGFRKAGEAGLRMIQLRVHPDRAAPSPSPSQPSTPAPTPSAPAPTTPTTP